MLVTHLKLVNSAGLIQTDKETEFDFRKRCFLEIYPEDGMQGIEILFCVDHYSGLRHQDMQFIALARKAENEGAEELKKFVNGFAQDPAIPYLKN
jgi:hypothetical protein